MKINDIKDYYANIYDEDSRLTKGCDNRHLVEKSVKMHIYKDILKVNSKYIRILDISCGTGLYSIELAKLGYNVCACDLCKNHIDLLNEKAKKLNLNIKAYTCDARSLPFENNSFDLVLLAGAIYHLEPEDKVKAINEAIRVCRRQKHILIDFLPKLHATYQNIARYGDLLPEKDKIFSYDSRENMQSYVSYKAKLCDFFSTDGITRLISYKINDMTTEQFNKYIAFCIKESKNQEIVDMSEHAIMNIVKN